MKVSERQLKEIIPILRRYSLKHSQELSKVNKDPEDFVQDVILNLLCRSDQSVDESKTVSLEGFIHTIALRELIDLRKIRHAKCKTNEEGIPISHISIYPSSEEEESFFEINRALCDPNSDTYNAYQEMIDYLPTRPISPTYTISWRQLFEMSVDYSPEEIGKIANISTNRVRQLQHEITKEFRSENPQFKEKRGRRTKAQMKESNA